MMQNILFLVAIQTEESFALSIVAHLKWGAHFY